MAKILRSGYTTGACAAAGVKAALIFMTANKIVNTVKITALDGTILTIPIKNLAWNDKLSACTVEVIKDAGDDPDITNGTSVFTTLKKVDGDDTEFRKVDTDDTEFRKIGTDDTEVKRVDAGGSSAFDEGSDGSEIVFKGGEGIGKVTRAGLAVPVGEPAINPGPRQLIKNVIKEFFTEPVGFEVTISIPAGVELAKRTLNPVLGIEGGISVIGTTGVLRPMSEEAFKKSLVPQIEVALAAGFKTLIFVPGKIGEVAAIKSSLPEKSIVQTSNFIGYMLEAAVERKVERVILFGHLGKLAKVAAGVFYTHNRIADGRLETIAAYAAAEGLSRENVKKILAANTTDEAIKIIEAANLQSVYSVIAERASLRAKRYIFSEMKIGTVLVDRDGNILGKDIVANDFLLRFQKEG